MSLLQAIVASTSSGGGASAPPPSINNFTWDVIANEGATLTLQVYVNNWTGSRIYWEVVGGGSFPITPSSDITGASSGYVDTGTTDGWVTLGTITFASDSTTEGTEGWSIIIGSTAGASDYYATGPFDINDTSQGGPMPGGDGTSGEGQYNGTTYTLTPKVNGTGNVGTANPGDVITWEITSSPTDTSGRTMHWWVDNNRVPAGTFVENVSNGTVTLDGSGTGSFSLTVVSSVPTHNTFRMYVGMSLYQGFVTHGLIGV